MSVTVSVGRAHMLIELHGSLNGVVSPVWRPTFLSTAKEKQAKERCPKLTSPHQKTMRVPENYKDDFLIALLNG